MQHFLDTSGDKVDLTELKLPLTFCLAKQTKIRLQSDSSGSDLDDWKKREDDWREFWKPRGKETLDNKRTAAVNGIAICQPLFVLYAHALLRNTLGRLCAL